MLWVGVALVLAASGESKAKPCTQAPAYVNRNQIDYQVTVSRIEGHVVDADGVAIPGSCVAVFSEPDHRLLASFETDDSGHFALPKLARGDYRLVAMYDSYCPVNARMRVSRRGGPLRLKMVPSGIDTCSYAELAK